MCRTQIVVPKLAIQTVLQVPDRYKTASLEELTGQHAEEQLDLVKPRTMNRHEMEYVLVLGVTQERPALLLGLETLRMKPNPTQLGHTLAQFQRQVGVEVVQNPVVRSVLATG